MNVRRGFYEPPYRPKEPWERKYTPPPSKPLPSVRVEDVTGKAVMTSVNLDDRVRALQKKFNKEAELQFRAKMGRDIPPPGKIEILEENVDAHGRFLGHKI